MFGPPFLAPSSCEMSSADPEQGCSVTLEAAGEVCHSSPRPRRPYTLSRLRAGHRLEISSSILNLSPSPKKTHHRRTEEMLQVYQHKKLALENIRVEEGCVDLDPLS